jgi:hypothetical protein
LVLPSKLILSLKTKKPKVFSGMRDLSISCSLEQYLILEE